MFQRWPHQNLFKTYDVHTGFLKPKLAGGFDILQNEECQVMVPILHAFPIRSVLLSNAHVNPLTHKASRASSWSSSSKWESCRGHSELRSLKTEADLAGPRLLMFTNGTITEAKEHKCWTPLLLFHTAHYQLGLSAAACGPLVLPNF